MTAIQYISQLATAAAAAAAATDLAPVTQGSTGPGTGTTRKMTLAGAAKGVLGSVNVRAFGAVGDGVTDDAAAIQAANDALGATGGTIVFPPGNYFIKSGIVLDSNRVVQGAGAGATTMTCWASFVDPGSGGTYSFFSNRNFSAVSITDANFLFEGIMFDMTPLGVNGIFKAIVFRQARNVAVQNCRFLGGGNAVGFLACSYVWETNNYAEGFYNCAWDHWEACQNVWTVNNTSIGPLATNAAQHINFNAIDTAGGTGFVAQNFTCTGNTCIDNVGSAIQLEPLGTSSTNKIIGVVFSNNKLTKVQLAVRGAVQSATINGNTWTSGQGPEGAIVSYSFFGGGVPDAIAIHSNIIYDPATTDGFGVIRCQNATNVSIVGNVITGSGYGPGIYTGATTGALVADNYISNGSYTAPSPISSSTQITVPNNTSIGSYDTLGGSVYMAVQSDNNWVFNGIDGAGAARPLLSIAQRSSTSQFSFAPAVDIGSVQPGYVRVQGDTALLGPLFQTQSASTNVPLRIAAKGTSPVVISPSIAMNSSAGATIASGTGAASGTQPKGSIWMRTDGAVGTTMYVSQGGGTWNAVAGV